jgi:hypothetical protein
MGDYVYRSENMNLEPSSNFDQEEPMCEPQVQASTTLDELDELEIINRNAGEFNKIPAIDNPYPDILKKPIFTSTIVDTTSNINAPVVEPSFIPKTALKDMTINEFASTIANSLIDIINDLLRYRGEDDLTEIFTKDSRLLAVGVLLLIISIFFIFFKNVD